MKEAKVTKDLENIKKSQATEEGVKDFFKTRDKRKKKASEIIEDINHTLGEEADEKERLYQESLKSKDIPTYVVPMFNSLFVTARRNKTKTDDGFFLPTASFGGEGSTDLEIDFSDVQTVLSVGPQVNQVMPGMEVKLNMEAFKRKLDDTLAQKLNKKHEYLLPVEVIHGVEVIKISERDISYISNSMGLTKEIKN